MGFQMKLTINLPYPPTVNTYYATVKGRRVLSKKGREYKISVLHEILSLGDYKFRSGKILIHIKLYVPDRRKRDIDNAVKSLLDSIVYADLIKDDSLVFKLIVEKFDYDEENNNFCTVQISDMTE